MKTRYNKSIKASFDNLRDLKTKCITTGADIMHWAEMLTLAKNTTYNISYIRDIGNQLLTCHNNASYYLTNVAYSYEYDNDVLLKGTPAYINEKWKASFVPFRELIHKINYLLHIAKLMYNRLMNDSIFVRDSSFIEDALYEYNTGRKLSSPCLTITFWGDNNVIDVIVNHVNWETEIWNVVNEQYQCVDKLDYTTFTDLLAYLENKFSDCMKKHEDMCK